MVGRLLLNQPSSNDSDDFTEGLTRSDSVEPNHSKEYRDDLQRLPSRRGRQISLQLQLSIE